ncbi:iron-sulfur cluster biosynthesis family protein [Laceyella putida]|uniref:Iron-sulfur cluster biosynthesis family protein n=1 Tax=Laceyella putida TaxID=110101 RepID=A0ABW2RMS4_9BACL
MNITVSDRALTHLLEAKPTDEAVLRIAAITEGCGCSADAAFEMNWDYAKPDDVKVTVSQALQVVLDRESVQFFGPALWVDWHEAHHAYVLKNKEQIFANHLML